MKVLTVEEAKEYKGDKISIFDLHGSTKDNLNTTEISGLFRYTDKSTGRVRLGVFLDGMVMHCVNGIKEHDNKLYLSTISFGGAYYPYEGINYCSKDKVDIDILIFDDFQEMASFVRVTNEEMSKWFSDLIA
jgi:hypothetical protein